MNTKVSTDTITYVTTEIGIIRAGFTVFPISPRNSPEAIAHLLKKTGARMVLVSGEPVLQKLAAATLEILNKDEDKQDLVISTMPQFEDLYTDKVFNGDCEPYPSVNYNLDAPAIIMHSSGWSIFNAPLIVK